MLLPHVGQDAQQLPTLELGRPDRPVRSARLMVGHVRGLEPGAPRPLVLLVGCDTADDPVAFHNLMARFLHLEAAAVLSTISKVRGPEAARAVTELVRLLLARQGASRSFGEILLEAKRQLLARCDPLALSLIAFGDLDVAVR